MGLATETFRSALERMLAFDVEGYVELFAADALIEWPFAPPEWPHRRAQGKEQIRTIIGANLEVAKKVGRIAVHDLVTREADEGGAVIAELSVEIRAADGSATRMPYVYVVQVAPDGHITESREYFGPATAQTGLRLRAAGS